ncbi:hypothetical protein [Neisseria sp. Ec49-e6-T10]|uniref:hypothetical protein n=1 Tax=Neisseria sp. Ec49-e6-T10 TaxID=3140744 RepID=UPI003EBA0D5B
MNYSAEQGIKNDDDIDHIIQQVFQISGVKLTADDPIVAVLFLQEKNQSAYSLALQKETQKLLDSISEIKKYREQVLMELMGEAKRSSEQAEEQVIGIVNAHLSEFKHSLASKDSTLNKVYLLIIGMVGIVIGMVLRSLF